MHPAAPGAEHKNIYIFSSSWDYVVVMITLCMQAEMTREMSHFFNMVLLNSMQKVHMF